MNLTYAFDAADRPIPINFGQIDPEDLIGRDTVLDLCWRRLEQGSSLLMTEERRIGKSSIAQTLSARPNDGWVVLYANVEAISSVEGLVSLLVQRLPTLNGLDRKARAAVRDVLGRVSEVTGPLGIGVSFREGQVKSPHEILVELISKLSSVKLLVILDELPILAQTLASNSIDDALLLLRTLRSLRATYGNHRQLLCGSIGFHHLLAEASEIKAATNDLFTVPIGALDDASASELARRLLLGIGRSVTDSDPIVDAIVRATDGIPFYEHNLIAGLEQAQTLTLDAVAAARHRGTCGADDPWKTAHYVERIADYFGDKSSTASAALDSIAQAGDSGLTLDELVNILSIEGPIVRANVVQIVDRLRLDHYIDYGVDDRLRFCFAIVRDSWRCRRRT